MSSIIVHHTVNGNNYACSDVPKLLRGIQNYHQRGQGWNDIGYNVVIDRCGGVWEARSGGVTRAVIGAHASGFNTGTIGVALLGTHSSSRPSLKARNALTRFIAWRTDIGHVFPNGRANLEARVSGKFKLGQNVSLPVVSGHRDVYSTDCPGALAYRDLALIRRNAARMGGLRLGGTAHHVKHHSDGSVSSVRITAHTNNASANTRVSLVNRAGVELAMHESSSGRKTVLEATFVPGSFDWDMRVHIEAIHNGQKTRDYNRALVTYGPDPQLSVTVPPPVSVIIPRASTQAVPISMTYQLAEYAAVKIGLLDHSGTYQIMELTSTIAQQEGTTVQRNIQLPSSLADGDYIIEVSATDDAPKRSVRHFALNVQSG